MRIKDNQSLFYIAVQQGGSVDTAFDYAVKNNISVSGSLTITQAIESITASNQQVADYFEVKSLTPATASTSDIAKQRGIGYMTIEEDFTVSQ